jgi:hypothetical protein
MTGDDLRLIAAAMSDEADSLQMGGAEATALLGNSLERIADRLIARAAKLDARDRELIATAEDADEFAGQYAADDEYKARVLEGFREPPQPSAARDRARARARVLQKYAPPQPDDEPGHGYWEAGDI